MMKFSLALLVTFLCLVSLVHCYGGNGYDPLGKFLEAQSLKGSVDFANEALESEHLLVYVGCQEGLKQANKVTKMMGQPDGVNFDQYSGYVTIDPKAGRALFYYFVESHKPSSKPLVLWLNGGPGCSSLGAGAMSELGPFRVHKDGKTLWRNEYAWNKVANIIFLESPAGVGFSYSNTSSDYKTGDKQTARDAYTFLINWLERFPEYKTRDFFITGESYGGHYVPQLARLILHNNRITNQTVINLKGIAIGNAFVDIETQLQGSLDFYWTHSLISDEIHEGIVSSCCFSVPLKISKACLKYRTEAAAAVGSVYGYDIYAPLCSSKTAFPSLSGFDPCSDDYVFSYLNIPEVQKALHANSTGIPGPWGQCNDYINGNWQDGTYTVLPTIKEVMASGIRVWLYSGDTDGVVPVTTTRYAMKKLGVSVKTPWYPWYNNGEVGGYGEGYENITFVTIRGAGHFVPSYQPARALALFSSFIKGKLPPSN